MAIGAARFDRAFGVAADQVANGTAPWAVLGVADAQRVVRLEAYSAPGGPVVEVASVGLLASITKPIVATVVIQLVADGRLVLTEPIERILRHEGAASDPPVTPWHLLTHTSGLADLDLVGLLSQGATHEDVLRMVLAEPPTTVPGASFQYVTSTFDLLAEVISVLEGRPYPEAIRARLLQPLGMADTTFDPRGLGVGRLVLPIAAPLATDGELPEAVLDAFIAMAIPGAGLWGSAPDLLRFGRALLRGGELEGTRILSPAFVELMTREATVDGIGATGDPTTAGHYALGWGKPGIATPGSARAFGHAGATGTRLWIDPAADLVFVYLTGAWGHPIEPIDAVMNAVYAALD